MSKPNIAQMIAEQRQCLSEIGNMVAKGGKGQSLAQHRQEVQSAILDVLVWCQANADDIRDFKKAKGQAE
jgi:hypothetical protein